MSNPIFKKIVSTKTVTISIGNSKKTITNTNELLGTLDGVYGVKTGFTGNALRCLVSACRRGNLDIIVVVLGAGTKKQRTEDSINLINYAFSNFEIKNIKELIDNNFSQFSSKSNQYFILKKSNSPIELRIEELNNYNIPINKKNVNNINVKIYYLISLEAPLKENSKIGVLSVYEGENAIINLDIYLSKPIYKNTIFENFLTILKSFAYI